MWSVCKNEKDILKNRHVEILVKHISNFIIKRSLRDELWHSLKTYLGKLCMVMLKSPYYGINESFEILFICTVKTFDGEEYNIFDQSKEASSEIHVIWEVIANHVESRGE